MVALAEVAVALAEEGAALAEGVALADMVVRELVVMQLNNRIFSGSLTLKMTHLIQTGSSLTEGRGVC